MNAGAQDIPVPQPSPYSADDQTILLEHFEGNTTGNPQGSVIYTNGVFGQGVHLEIGSSVFWWGVAGLPEGTVEFWAKRDNLNDQSSALVHSYYGEFIANMFIIKTENNYVFATYATDPPENATLLGMPVELLGSPSMPRVTSGWHHYAASWGKHQGFNFYFDGRRVYSNSNTQSGSVQAGMWLIGGFIGGESLEAGFAGVIDELRISKMQRGFAVGPASTNVPPTLNLRIRPNLRKAIYVDSPNLTTGRRYQVQASGDLVTFTNVGTAFTATNSNWRSDTDWDVDNWPRLFIRLREEP